MLDGGKALFKQVLGLSFALATSALVHTSASAAPVFFADPVCYGNAGTIPCDINMQDFGGPTMTGTTDIYNIWYGNWGTDPSVSTLAGLFSDITGSKYMNIGSLYGVSTQIDFKGTTLVNDYLGDHLSDSDLGRIVTDFTNPSNPHGGPAENNAIYFIYTAPNIREEEDNVACAFHSDVGGLKFAWVSGFNAQPFEGCGNQGETKSITSSASHEFFESLTDPLVNEATDYAPPLAWYDAGPTDQGEVGDPCGASSFTTRLNGVAYVVQSIFVNDSSRAAGGFCASRNTISPSVVPEPAPWAFMIIGFGLMGAAIRWRVAGDDLRGGDYVTS